MHQLPITSDEVAKRMPIRIFIIRTSGSICAETYGFEVISCLPTGGFYRKSSQSVVNLTVNQTLD